MGRRIVTSEAPGALAWCLHFAKGHDSCLSQAAWASGEHFRITFLDRVLYDRTSVRTDFCFLQV